MKRRVEEAVKNKANERYKNQEFAMQMNQKLFISNSFVLKNSRKFEERKINQYWNKFNCSLTNFDLFFICRSHINKVFCKLFETINKSIKCIDMYKY